MKATSKAEPLSCPFCGHIGNAVELVRQQLARWGNTTLQPVPVSERLPGPEDCDKEIKVAAKVIPGDNQQ